MFEPVDEPLIPQDVKAHSEFVPAEKGRWRLSMLRGLVWAEWFAHSKLLLTFVVLWLLSVWTLPLIAHPTWILLLGGIYAIFAGPAYGGGDVLDGSEEYVFSLPPTRGERYWARFAVGAGILSALTAINLLALGFELPQVLAGLYIKSGLLKPSPVPKTGFLYGLVMAFPFAIFVFSFVLSALSHSRTLILTAWFWAVLIALLMVKFCFWYEEFLADQLTGYFACPFLFLASIAALCVGYRFYRQKEVGDAVVPITLPGRWWLWILVFLLGLALVMILTSSLVQQYPKFLIGPDTAR